jgi:hypothetical protein
MAGKIAQIGLSRNSPKLPSRRAKQFPENPLFCGSFTYREKLMIFNIRVPTIPAECHQAPYTVSVGQRMIVNEAIIKESAAPHGQGISPSGEQQQSRSGRPGLANVSDAPPVLSGRPG